MSIIGYAAITNGRDASNPGATFRDATEETTNSKKTYIDALAALVPAEVLAAHALVISYATKTENKVATITDPDTLWIAFWSLCTVSLILYAVPRAIGGRWKKGIGADSSSHALPSSVGRCCRLRRPLMLFFLSPNPGGRSMR